jgi:hypothetical protein
MLTIDSLLKIASSPDEGLRSQADIKLSPVELADRMEMIAVKLGSVSTGVASGGLRDADRNTAAMALAEFMGKLAGTISNKRLKGIDRRLLSMFAGSDSTESLARNIDITDRYEALTGTRLQ